MLEVYLGTTGLIFSEAATLDMSVRKSRKMERALEERDKWTDIKHKTMRANHGKTSSSFKMKKVDDRSNS